MKNIKIYWILQWSLNKTTFIKGCAKTLSPDKAFAPSRLQFREAWFRKLFRLWN